MGTTKAFFQSIGSFPWWRDALNIKASTGDIESDVSSRNLAGIPSGPCDL